MRWKSGFGSAAVAAIALGTLGVTPALAEQPTPTPVDEPREQRAADATCDSATFPLALGDGGETYTVTRGDDGTEDGTLRWAFEQANAHPGIDEIVIAEDIQVSSTGGVELTDGLILRGANATSEIINVTDAGADLISAPVDAGCFPVFIADLKLSGSPDATEPRGVWLEASVSALGLHGVTVRDFTEYGVTIDSDDQLERLEILDSSFTGTTLPDVAQVYSAAFILQGPTMEGSVVVKNSDFSDNGTTGMAVMGMLSSSPEGRGSLLVEQSRFVNNAAWEEEVMAGGLFVEYVDFTDVDEDDPSIIPATGDPVVTVRDTLFQGNSGAMVGGMSVLSASSYTEGAVDPVTLVKLDRTTFTANASVAPELGYGLPASDLRFEDSYFEGASESTMLSVSDSTFTDAVDPSIPTIRFETLAGIHRFEHVTLVGGGVAYGDVDEVASVDLRNSVFDTGDRTPITHEAFALARAAADTARDGEPTFAEQQMAYTTAPPLVTEGPGRVMGASADFNLGALDSSLGLTPVRVPGSGSVLIDAAGPGGAAQDQRGLARPQGPAADIGAVEVKSAPATIQIGEDQTVAAGDTLGFTVTRQDATEDPWTGKASVRVTTADGTAVAGKDYTAVNTVITWAAGDTAPKPVAVPTDAGHKGEGDVTLTVTLSEPSAHAVLGARTTATGTIEREAGSGVVVPPKPDTKPGTTPLASSGGDPATGWLIAAALLTAAGASLLMRRRGKNA